MAAIVISFNTTAKQDAKLAKVLASINADRVSRGEAAFATIEEYLRSIVVDAVKSYVKRQDEVDSGAVATAYDAASDSIQAQVRAALGL